MSNRGFTLIEIVISSGIFAMLLGAVAISVHNEDRTHAALIAPISPMMHAQKIMNRVASELRMASLQAEDRDADGEEDEGEDTNANGVLDSDWSLADGARENELSFNRRIDYKDDTGELVTGHFSRRIHYKLEGDNLVREWDFTNDSGATETRRIVLAEGVTSIEFHRKDKVVTVTLGVKIPVRNSDPIARTLTTSIWLRN